MTSDPLLRHLEDLCRQAENRNTWRYSGFLSVPVLGAGLLPFLGRL